MKTLTLAATLVVATATFAAPGFAMDNPVAESRAKIESVLASHKAKPTFGAVATIRATTFSAKNPVHLNRYQLAHKRLFANRSGPSGR